MDANEAGVRAIAAVDPRFDVSGFVEGAKGAYQMVLEAFWQGDRETLRAAGFSGLRLGPRILRTETAGLAAIAALQSRFGDL